VITNCLQLNPDEAELKANIISGITKAPDYMMRLREPTIEEIKEFKEIQKEIEKENMWSDIFLHLKVCLILSFGIVLITIIHNL